MATDSSQTTELAAIERWKKSPYTYNGENGVSKFSRLFFVRVIFILAGNYDIHKSLDEFEIRLDPTQDHKVTCP